MTGTDLLPTASSLFSDIGDMQHVDEEEDAAGYEAMMSELPTIVSMSGLLDGDFDELNEIQNLLAPPVSDDDDAEEGSSADAAAAAMDAADQAVQDAYIQAMVPNPIPTGTSMSGLEVSAAAAALDEELGFPAGSLMTASTAADGHQESSYVDSSSEELASTSNFSVRAPAKRVHKQVGSAVVSPMEMKSSHPAYPQPFSFKKAKLGGGSSPSRAQTPATIRTSLDGCSAPNPLLFGRPIQFPSDSKFEPPKQPASKVIRVSLKPKLSQKGKSSAKAQKTSGSSPATVRPLRQVVSPTTLRTRKFLTPETDLSYLAPPCLAGKLKEFKSQPPLCKLLVKGKIEAIVGTTESAIARIPAPPLKSAPKHATLSSTVIKTKINATSATASKRNASTTSKKKKVSSSKSTAKKINSVKAKKTSATQGKNKASTAAPSQDTKKPSNTNEIVAPPVVAAHPKKLEKLMVANPLANVPPTAPIKLVAPTQSKPKTPASSSQDVTKGATAPAMVSSNCSTASIDFDDQDMDTDDRSTTSPSTDTDKLVKTSTNPMTFQEKAQACRDRNRQHARNTRLRKKAYVEELKHSLNKLAEERDRKEAARKEEESLKEKKRQARSQVLRDFLQCRGHNERDSAKWERLVQDPKTFQLNLPITKFQTMVAVSKTADQHILAGIQDAMADASYFASFLQSLGSTGHSATEKDEIANEKAPVYLDYNCTEGPFLLDGDAGLLSWKATTRGAVFKGATSELSLNGSIKGVFCPDSNKLASATMMFDTGAIQAQLASSHHHHHLM